MSDIKISCSSENKKSFFNLATAKEIKQLLQELNTTNAV